MPDRQLFLLSPYRPPTSYPVSLAADDVTAWLNGYAALWHPAAVRGAVRPPQPAGTYDHDQPTAGAVYAVPSGPHLYQPDDWQHRAATAPAVAFTATPDRGDTVAAMLGELGATEPFDPAVVRAFAGLGFGYLMLDTLCDAMSHDRLLDADAFWADVQAAATATDSAMAMDHLRAAAEKMRVARESMTSGTIRILDWVILADDTFGEPWPTPPGRPATLFASAEQLERLAADFPARFAELKASGMELACGAYRERDDAWLPPESQLWNLTAARTAAAKLFGEPAAYARWRSAFHAMLPSWLVHAGYKYAVAQPFDGATVPGRYATVVNWPAADGRAVEAVVKEPLKADEPATFFNLAYHAHQAHSHDSNPTLALLHRGKPPAAGYDDWQALAELAPVLGEWQTFAQFFADAPTGEFAAAAAADDFFTDTLDDRVTVRRRPDPVSGFARHLRLRRRLDSALALAALDRSLGPPTADAADLLRTTVDLETAIETRGPDVGPAGATDELAAKLEPVEATWANKLAERIQARAAAGTPGFLVFNPCGFTRRVALELTGAAGPIPADGAVKASEYTDGVARVVVEVPGLGFAWLPKPAAGPPPKPRIVTADGTTVRNEFFEADLDPATGGLRGFRDARSRINRIGQALVFNPGSKQKVDAVTVTHAGAALGEVTSRGTITDEHDKPLAAFRQRIRAWVGRPALEMRIELEPAEPPVGYPWHNYFGARFAWRDERTAILRGANGATSRSFATKPCSPDFVEVRFGSQATYVFTGGLPFVQKHGSRMFDAVLFTEGETATSFDFLLALDRDHPMQTAAGWTAPAPVVVTEKGPPPGGASGWLAHCDMPSLLLTAFRPGAEGRAVVARFLETAGFAGAAELRFARDPTTATMIDATGATLHPVTLIGDAVPVEFSANELFTVRAEWV